MDQIVRLKDMFNLKNYVSKKKRYKCMKKNDEELFALIKEKLYTPVVGDILDQMGYCHQFLPAYIKPLESLVPSDAYIDRTEEDHRLKLVGSACTVLENDVFGPPKKPFRRLTEALDHLRPNEIFVATGARNTQQNTKKQTTDSNSKEKRSDRCSTGWLQS